MKKFLFILIAILCSFIIKAQTVSVQLNGSGSYDSDGTIVAYNWTIFGAPPGSSNISSPTSSITNITGLGVVGNYYYQLKVTDNQGGIGTAIDTVTVGPANQVPHARTTNSHIYIQLTSFNGSRRVDNNTAFHSFLHLDRTKHFKKKLLSCLMQDQAIFQEEMEVGILSHTSGQRIA